MRMNDMHLEEGFARCIGKGNKERIVSLNPVARRRSRLISSTNGRGSWGGLGPIGCSSPGGERPSRGS